MYTVICGRESFRTLCGEEGLQTLVSDGHAGGQEGEEEGQEEGQEDHWEQVDVWFGIKDLVQVH